MSQMAPSSNILCKNCQTSFEGKFCPNCSQKADTHRFSLLHFIHEAIHAITHTDKGIFFLMKGLLTKPGTVALEYNNGMRKKYFNPITFLLIMTAIQIFAAQKTGFYSEFATSMKASIEQLLSNATPEMLQKLDEQTDKPVTVAVENSKLLTLLFIPLLSFFTWSFFRKSGNNYAENLVFNVMIEGELVIIFLVFAIIPFLILPSFVILWMGLFFLLSFIYTLIAYHQFYKQRWYMTILKWLGIHILYIFSVQQLTSFIVSII